MVTTRLYGRKGFTEKKAVKEILAPLEAPPKRGVIPLRGLAPKQAQALMGQLPPEQLEDRVTDAAPTFAEMVAFADGIEGSKLIGLRVPPGGKDERISLYGFEVPQPNVDPTIMQKVADRGADAKVRWVRRGKEVLLEVTW